MLSSHQGENPSPFQSKHGDDAGHAHLGWNRHWTSKVWSERDESKQFFFQMDSFEPSCVHQFMLWSLTKHFFSGAVQIYHVTVVFRRAASRSTSITHATLNTTRPKSQISLERVKSETPKNLNPTLQVTNLTGRFEEAGSVARLTWAIGCRFYSFGTRKLSADCGVGVDAFELRVRIVQRAQAVWWAPRPRWWMRRVHLTLFGGFPSCRGRKSGMFAVDEM